MKDIIKPQIILILVVVSLFYVSNQAFAGLSGDFPQAMSFRAQDGDLYTYSDYSGYAVVHEDKSDADVLLDIESHDPSVTTIAHLAYATISRNRYSQVSFPGFWLFEAGSLATSGFDTTNLDATDCGSDHSQCVEVEVDLIDRFVVGDQVAIYQRTINSSGTFEPDWSVYEEALVVNIDGDNLYLVPAQLGTTSRSWQITSTTEIAIAPHALTWGSASANSKQWGVNIALHAPTDPNNGNQTGYEFFAEYVNTDIWERLLIETDRFGNITLQVDGVEFDGGRWQYNSFNKPIDSNNDLEPDYGYVEGFNSFGLGGIKFIEELKALMPTAIVQVDSSIPQWGFRWIDGSGAQQKKIHGIEMENFPLLDNYDKFSSGFLHLLSWNESNHTDSSLDTFNYGFTKDDTAVYDCDATTAPSDNNNFRIGLGTSLVLGNPFPYAAETEGDESSTGDDEQCFDLYDWDELFGTSVVADQDMDWLGQPLTGYYRIQDHLSGPDLFQNSANISWSHSVVTPNSHDIGYQAVSQTSSGPFKTLEVLDVPMNTYVDDNANKFYPHVDGAYLDANLNNGFATSFSSDEYTVKFYAVAENRHHHPDAADLDMIPRLLRVMIVATDGSREYQDVLIDSNMTDNLYLTFRFDSAKSIRKIRFASGEQIGKIKLTDIEVYMGSSDRFVRYFDGGAVLINMSNDTWTYDLDTAYGSFAKIDGSQDAINDNSPGATSDFNQFDVDAQDAIVVRGCDYRDLECLIGGLELGDELGL